MTRRGYFIRLAISILIDILNATVGHIPFVIGEAQDGISAGALFVLWGPVGLISLWELGDPTEIIDGLIPTATLIALYVGWKKGFIFRKNPPAQAPAVETPRLPPSP